MPITISGTSLDSTTALSIPNTSYGLTANSGKVFDPNLPCGLMYPNNTTPQTTSGTTVRLNYAYAANLQGGMTFSATDGRMTVPQTGLYRIDYCVSTEETTTTNAGDGIVTTVYKNGALVTGYNEGMTPTFSAGKVIGEEANTPASLLIELNANDYIQIYLTSVDHVIKIFYGYVFIHLVGK